MNAQEFYNYIVADAKLEAAFEEAIDSGSLDGFIKEHGYTGSVDELTNYVAEHSQV